MKRIFVISKLALVLFALVIFNSCDKDQEVAPVIDPSWKPSAEFAEKTSFNGGTLNRLDGDVMTIGVTMSKMLDESVTFSARLTEASEADDHDADLGSSIMASYSTETEVSVEALNIHQIVPPKVLEFEVGNFGGVANRYLLHPNQTYPTYSVTIEGQDKDGLLFEFGWEDPADDHHDLDLLGISDVYGAWSAEATGDNPEFGTMVWNEDDDGTYYIGFDPYSLAGNVVEWYLKVQQPAGQISEFTGTFDTSKADTYVKDYFNAWDIYIYRLLTVEKTGNTYKLTQAMK